MELIGFEVEAQAATAEDRATEAGRWFVEQFGVVPRLTAYVTDLPRDTDRITGPAGMAVDLVRPEPVEHHERQISEFIDSAADLAGPATEQLADDVLAIVAASSEAIGRLLDGVAHDKVLATHLLLSQQSRRDSPADAVYWQRSAASTLLSPFIGRGD